VNGSKVRTERPRFEARTMLGLSFLAFQLVMIGCARFVPWRYFCWVLNDYNIEYTPEVTANGPRDLEGCFQWVPFGLTASQDGDREDPRRQLQLVGARGSYMQGSGRSG
jgi:hypothetical protein